MSTSTSMSCSPSPSPQHHTPSPALDLLDDYWFFSNTLASNKPPSRSPSSTSTTTRDDGRQMMMSSNKGSGSGSVLGARKFLRTPSLPSPRRRHVVEEEEVMVDQDEEVVHDDDLNWSSIYQGVLRTRTAAERGSRSSAALQRAPSMPVVPSSSSSSKSSMPNLRHSYSTLGRHQPSSTGAIAKQQQQHHGVPGGGSNNSNNSASKKSGAGFQDKKWKSSSDLESIEVQGFRDLGFVFDKEELRESLADVLPGLKQQQQRQRHHHDQMQSPGSAVPRPYLSEAWQQPRRPALVRVQSSSAEMKDQLRMWAQAVACNVRHEC
ncbi:hypothetical protein U9M48_021344 [Paspalum notatum var. saurae]|uniref:Uncharacterized protein n=1 Tax=Paspalum notatum var. saurae TaxID=547442 RepID=A0AAQ3TIV4_PASNO